MRCGYGGFMKCADFLHGRYFLVFDHDGRGSVKIDSPVFLNNEWS